MYGWPSNWRQEALRAIGVPVTQHALDVLSAWFASTPTQPWTNNPLGLSANTHGMPTALNTDYAVFPTHGHFRSAFKSIVNQSPGKVMVHVLLDEGDLASAWRAIHALNLPGNGTESDYPVKLLDMIERKYRNKLQTVAVVNRKSMGSGARHIAPHSSVQSIHRRLSNGASDMQSFVKAVHEVTRVIGQ